MKQLSTVLIVEDVSTDEVVYLVEHDNGLWLADSDGVRLRPAQTRREFYFGKKTRPRIPHPRGPYKKREPR